MEVALFGELIHNLNRAHRGMIRLNAAVQQNRENGRAIQRLRRSLIKVGGIIVAVAIFALMKPPLRVIHGHPTLMHVIFLAILGFILVSGLAALMIGMLIKNNPGRVCHHLTVLVLWAIHFATALSIGVLLACFSSA